jgi:hypothetical protein
MEESHMFEDVKTPPTPTEEQALDFLTETLRSRENAGRNSYEVYRAVVVDRFVRLRITVPPGIDIQNHIEALMGPFFAAAWSLCNHAQHDAAANAPPRAKLQMPRS